MKKINNNYVYHPDTTSVHVIDVGAELTYCDVKRSQIGEKGRYRRYTLIFPEDQGYELCPVCHAENRRRHFEVCLQPIKA